MQQATVVAPLGRPANRVARSPVPRLHALAGGVEPDRLRAQHVSLDALGEEWCAAFDAAEVALSSAGSSLTAVELRQRRDRLARERERTVVLLEAVARDTGAATRFSHLLSLRSELRPAGREDRH